MVSQHIIKIILEAEDRISKVVSKVEDKISKFGAKSKNTMSSASNATNKFSQSVVKANTPLGKVQQSIQKVGVTGRNSFNQLSSAQQRTLVSMSSMSPKAREVTQRINEIGVKGRSSFNQLTSAQQRTLISMSTMSGVSSSTSSAIGSAMSLARSKIGSLGTTIDTVKQKVISFGSSAKTSITSGFNTAVDSAKGKLNSLKTSLTNLANSAKGAGHGFNFLRTAASMTVGMLGYDLLNSMITLTRESLNAEGNFKAFGKRMNMTGSELKSFRSHVDGLQSSFKKVDMTAVGASALELGVKLKLPKESMEDMTKTVAVMSSAFVKEGRTQTDAILAVSDAMDGQFRRLQELGISQEMLKQNGWDGDIQNKTGLLQAMNKTLDEMGFTETAMQINTLDEAYQAITVSGAKFLASVLIPLTPLIIGLVDVFTTIVNALKSFGEAITAVWDGLPDWAQVAIQIAGVAIAIGLVVGYFGGLVGIAGALVSALAPVILLISGISLPAVAAAAAIGLIVYAVFEVGKAFGWWKDVGSMIEAIKAGLQRLWNAFINHPDVKATIKGIQDAWQGLSDFLKPVVDWLGGMWNKMFPPSAKGKVDAVRIIINLLGKAFESLKFKFMLVTMPIRAVISFLQLLYNVAKPVGEGIYNALKPIICVLLGCSPGILPALKQVYEVFTTVFSTIWSVISPIISSIVAIFMQIYNAISVIVSAFQQFANGQISLPQLILMVWTTIFTTISSIFSFIIGRVVEWAGQLLTNAYNAGKGFVDGVINWFKQLPGRVWSFLVLAIQRAIIFKNQIEGKAKEAGRNFINNLISFLKSLPGRVWSFLSSTISRVSSFASRVPGMMRSAGSRLVSAFISAITGLPGKVTAELGRVGQSVMSFGGHLYNKAKSTASRLLKGFLDGLGIHSPGLMDKNINEELDRIKDKFKDYENILGKSSKDLGTGIVDGFGSPTMDISAPSMPSTNISATTTVSPPDLSSMAAGISGSYDLIGSTVSSSMNNLVNTDKSAWNSITSNTATALAMQTANNRSAWSNINSETTGALNKTVNATKNSMGLMNKAVTSNMNSIANKNRATWNAITPQTSNSLRNIAQTTSTQTGGMNRSWSRMSSSVTGSARSTNTKSSAQINNLSNHIKTFYRRISTASFAGPIEVAGTPNNPLDMLDYFLYNDAPCTDCYAGPQNGLFAGTWDHHPKHVNKTMDTVGNYNVNVPGISGLGLKAKDFKNTSMPLKGSLLLFEKLANKLISGTQYDLYYNGRYSNQQALARGRFNCWDGAEILIGLAQALGLPASMARGKWGNIGHVAAVVGGKIFDTTQKQKRGVWRGASGVSFGPKPSGLDLFKDKNDKTSGNDKSNNVEVHIDDFTIHHDLRNVPAGLDEKEIAKMISEGLKDKVSNRGFIEELISNLVKHDKRVNRAVGG